MQSNCIYLIEKAWIDPLENDRAHGYDLIGYVETEEQAVALCENSGFYKPEQCWSIAIFGGTGLPKLRYEKLNKLEKQGNKDAIARN